MREIIQAAEDALRAQNHMGALFIALTLPDVAGSVMIPEEPHAGPRYKAWWGQYMEPIYTRPVGPGREPHLFLGREDAWALRCAMLHAGMDDVSGQKAHLWLKRFRFVEPPSGSFHMNHAGPQLQLQVSTFAGDIIAAALRFLEDSVDDPARQAIMARMVTIDRSANLVL